MNPTEDGRQRGWKATRHEAAKLIRAAVKATIVATVVGTGAWLFGLSGILSPAHPMMATFILTVVAYVLANAAYAIPR